MGRREGVSNGGGRGVFGDVTIKDGFSSAVD